MFKMTESHLGMVSGDQRTASVRVKVRLCRIVDLLDSRWSLQFGRYGLWQCNIMADLFEVSIESFRYGLLHRCGRPNL